MRIILAALSSAISLHGCTAEPSKEDILKSAAERAIRSVLRDSDSAKFSGWKIYPEANVACGKVNARNGFGGYSGTQDFAYRNGNVFLRDEDTQAWASASMACIRVDNARIRADIARSRAERTARRQQRAAD